MKKNLFTLLLIFWLIFSFSNNVLAENKLNLYTLEDYQKENTTLQLSENILKKTSKFETKVQSVSSDKQKVIYLKLENVLFNWYLYENKYSIKTKNIIVYIKNSLGIKLLNNTKVEKNIHVKNSASFWPYSIPLRVGDYKLNFYGDFEYDNSPQSTVGEYIDSKWNKIKVESNNFIDHSGTVTNISYCSNLKKLTYTQISNINISWKKIYTLDNCSKNKFFFIPNPKKTYYTWVIKYFYVSSDSASKKDIKMILYNITKNIETIAIIKHSDFKIQTSLKDGTIYIKWITKHPNVISYSIDWWKKKSLLQNIEWNDTFIWKTEFRIRFFDLNWKVIYSKSIYQSNNLSSINKVIQDNRIILSWKINHKKVSYITERGNYIFSEDKYIKIEWPWDWKLSTDWFFGKKIYFLDKDKKKIWEKTLDIIYY